MNWNEILNNFFANIFSDILTGIVIGGISSWIISWKVGRKLNEMQRKVDEVKKQKEDREKAKRYLELIGNEVLELDLAIKNYLKVLALHTDILGYSLTLETSYFDIVEKSGELATLLNPTLIQLLAHYYYQVKAAKLIGQKLDIDYISTGWSDYDSKTRRLIEKLEEKLKSADNINFIPKNIEDKGNLELCIKEEKDRLEIEIKELEILLRKIGK